MTKYYSKTSNGFYSSDINEGDIPEDAVEITDELWQELLTGQGAGMVISSDSSGNPVLTAPPAPSQDELVSMANNTKAGLIAAATVAIGPLQDADDLGIATDEETSELKAWKTYRVMLNRVDTKTAPDISWPVQPN